MVAPKRDPEVNEGLSHQSLFLTRPESIFKPDSLMDEILPLMAVNNPLNRLDSSFRAHFC